MGTNRVKGSFIGDAEMLGTIFRLGGLFKMTTTRFNAHVIADGIIHEMSRQGKAVDNLKINKLVFYADAVHHVLTGRALVDEDFQAWVHGPVIPSLYRRFKSFGWQDFGVAEALSEGPADEDAREAIRQVVDELGYLSGYELERRSHEVPSYIEARGDIPEDQPSTAVISKDRTYEYFDNLFAA